MQHGLLSPPSTRAHDRQQRAHGRPSSVPPNSRGVWGGQRRVTPRQGVPRPNGFGAQLAFKDSMVHGILQFTPSIAFRYVLHRCKSRDIRCRESFRHIEDDVTNRTHTVSGQRGTLFHSSSLAQYNAGVRLYAREGRSSASIEMQRTRRLPPEKRDEEPKDPSPPSVETCSRVQWTSRDVADSEPPTSPRSENFTGPFNR
ncbi:hypothetical protein M0R45_007190 [Rubus argutus]|uniref:Uncharacterized protein n=1 Tax=Rubus argutus TaxID=59490 RepID=A0AAW1YSM5_RUBAR